MLLHVQANHVAYMTDTTAYLGRLLNHDDEDQARGSETKLGRGFQTTCSLWQSTFGTPYPADGASYRWVPALSPSMLQL